MTSFIVNIRWQLIDVLSFSSIGFFYYISLYVLAILTGNNPIDADIIAKGKKNRRKFDGNSSDRGREMSFSIGFSGGKSDINRIKEKHAYDTNELKEKVRMIINSLL
jgi:hypothetical protein